MSCEKAAANVERDFGIPQGILQAITQVETGRTVGKNFSAWPWTINLKGSGKYFETKEQAEKFVTQKFKTGENSIDIGCFQINTKWHAGKFSSVTDMFDPELSAAYAASFLVQLKKEFGDWNSAIKNYHSRNKKRGNTYGLKVVSALNNILTTTKEPLPQLTPILPATITPSYSQGSIELVIFASTGPIIEHRNIQPLLPNRE